MTPAAPSTPPKSSFPKASPKMPSAAAGPRSFAAWSVQSTLDVDYDKGLAYVVPKGTFDQAAAIAAIEAAGDYTAKVR